MWERVGVATRKKRGGKYNRDVFRPRLWDPIKKENETEGRGWSVYRERDEV